MNLTATLAALYFETQGIASLRLSFLHLCCLLLQVVGADFKSNGCSNKNFFSMEMRVKASSLVS